jgi:hypothetical protein
VKLNAGDGRMQVIFGECELSVGDNPVDDALGKKNRGKSKRDGRSDSPPSPEESSTSNAE